MIVNGLVFFLLFCFWSYHSKRASAKITFAGMALLFVYFVAHYTLPDRTIEVKCPGPLLERVRPTIAQDDVIISDGDSIRSACWYLQRNDVYVLRPAGELTYGFGYPDAAERLLDLKSATELIRQHRGKTVLVARVRNVARWRDALPPPLAQEQNGDKGYVVLRF
jgi:4-amino-4-deoxy-L-arabinose transferase